MTRDRLHFLYLNIGHFLDHLFTLIFASVAALVLVREWGMTYAELVPYATPGFVAFGVFSLPSGWLADRWSREGMIAVFFLGIGAASIVTGFASTPLEIAIGLFVVGIFAAIYHPVGLALVARHRDGMGMAIAINGVWGNLGVGSAALITGALIDAVHWRAAFIVPGLLSIAVGCAYAWTFRAEISGANGARTPPTPQTAPSAAASQAAHPRIDAGAMRAMLIRLTMIIFFTTAVGSIIFQSTTFALPKVFEERLGDIAGSATLIGWLAFVVFAVASMAQLIVGSLLDRLGPRLVFIAVALIQIVFFTLMPGLDGWPALLVALAFMIGAFGQIPINDYMIGQTARSELSASIYGARYVVTFVVLALTLPLISWVHGIWGFDMLFRILAGAAVALLAAVLLLPDRLPQADAPQRAAATA